MLDQVVVVVGFDANPDAAENVLAGEMAAGLPSTPLPPAAFPRRLVTIHAINPVSRVCPRADVVAAL